MLAGVAIYFVSKDINRDEFFAKQEDVNYSWVVITMIIGSFGYIIRAYRWKLQIEPLGYKPSILSMFLAVMMGYLANLVLPRLGEVARCGTLYRTHAIPVSKSFGSVVTERIVDVLALLVILLITFFLQYDQLVSFIKSRETIEVNWALIGGILILVIGIGVFIFFRWIYPSQTKIGKFSRGMIEGLISLKDVRLGRFLVATISIWIVYFFMTYLMVFAMTETSTLSPEAGFAVLSAGVLAFVMPVQSGVGAFQGFVASMLLIYSINYSTGVFFATLLHASQLMVVLILGLVAVILHTLMKRNVERAENK